jgi:hypothetical protein
MSGGYTYIFGSHTGTVYIKCVPQQMLLPGFGGRKGSERHG